MEDLLQTNRNLDRIIASLGDLPASPAIISSLMGLTANINNDIEPICQAIMADQSLTAKVLKLSNSSFYGRTKEVRTLKEAVVLLGFKSLRSLVVASSTHSLYDTITDTDFRDKLWQHTLATALASRMIAKYIGHPFQEEAFLSGLMHDIGKLVLSLKVYDDYAKVVAKVESARAQFAVVEEELFGFNHTDVGLLLMHKWAFPKILSDAVFEHHHPDLREEKQIPLSFVVNLANFVAKNLGVGFDDYKIINFNEYPPAQTLGLNTDDLLKIQEELSEQFQSELELFLSHATRR